MPEQLDGPNNNKNNHNIKSTNNNNDNNNNDNLQVFQPIPRYLLGSPIRNYICDICMMEGMLLMPQQPQALHHMQHPPHAKLCPDWW